MIVRPTADTSRAQTAQNPPLHVIAPTHGTDSAAAASKHYVENDWEYRQAVIEEGYDPDDSDLRRAVADTVSLLRRITAEERAYDLGVDTSAERRQSVSARR